MLPSSDILTVTSNIKQTLLKGKIKKSSKAPLREESLLSEDDTNNDKNKFHSTDTKISTSPLIFPAFSLSEVVGANPKTISKNVVNLTTANTVGSQVLSTGTTLTPPDAVATFTSSTFPSSKIVEEVDSCEEVREEISNSCNLVANRSSTTVNNF